jgi:peptide deformylase
MEYAEKIDAKIAPIIAYGQRVLRTTCNEVNKLTSKVEGVISDLWNTLEVSGGVGLAAPQINNTQSIFVVKSTLMYNELSESQRAEYFSGDTGIEETFINATIVAESEETWNEYEGCLSIPGINEYVERPWSIIVEYRDADFNKHRKQFSGYTAKVIQHESDHTKGVLFIDHLPSLTKKLLKGRLKKIKEGKIETNYPIKYLKQ